LNHKIEHLHADVAREQTAHKKLHKAFDHFRSESKAEKARLTKDLDAARRKLNEGRSHDAKDHKIIEDLHRALDEGNKANALLQDKLDAKIKELLQTQQELQVAKDAHKIAENSIVRLNGEIEHLKKDLADRDSTIRKYESDMAQLRDANASLVSENRQLSTAIAQLREANALLVSEKNQLSKDLASKTAALQSAQEELTAAQNVVVAQKKTLSEQDHKIQTLQIQLNGKTKDFEDFKLRSKQREEKLQRENNELKEHDEEDHATISKVTLERKLHDLDDQNANKPLIEELLALKAQLAAANKEAADAKQRASDADAQRKSAEAAAAKAALEHDQAHTALLPNDVVSPYLPFNPSPISLL
jgi:chromosome segregation ATPase